MRADLHIHTYYSDGAYSPAQIAAMAKAAGLSLISMTDHDSLAGLEEKAQAARAQGLSYVPGWEVSAYQGELKVHILGYGCRICAPYEQFLRARIAGAVERAKDIIAKANEYFGLDVTLAEAERFHQKKDAPLHTMHIVAAFAARLGCNKGDLYAAAFERASPVTPHSGALPRGTRSTSSTPRAASPRWRIPGASSWRTRGDFPSWTSSLTRGWTA